MQIARSPQPDESNDNSRGGDVRDGTADDNSRDDSRDRRRELIRYAGLSTQVVVSIGVSVFLGMKADKALKVSFPILSWALPLLVIVVLLINLVREGSGKKNGK
jgi:Mn2+/Fe2+ NRAMP family transporter